MVEPKNYFNYVLCMTCMPFFISELRRQARTLENDIDVKLVAFSKLGISSGSANINSETAPLINSDDMFDTMSMELQQLLNQVIVIIYSLKLVNLFLQKIQSESSVR